MPDRICTVCRKQLAPGAGVERFHASNPNRRFSKGRTPYYHCDACWAAKEREYNAELDALTKRRK